MYSTKNMNHVHVIITCSGVHVHVIKSQICLIKTEAHVQCLCYMYVHIIY